jgi:polysaccharide deacetylase 2 family uncharacterized protein YibQ
LNRSQGGVSSVLKILGINPAVGALALALVLLCGITLGLLTKNAMKKPALKPEIRKEASPAEPVEARPEESDNDEPEAMEREQPETRTEINAQSPFARNALAGDWDSKGPIAAIIIDDMGVDMARSNRILKIEAPLTVSYMPHAPNLQAQIDIAREEGKEVMLHIPMEAMNSAYALDYGPEHLRTTESRNSNVRLLRDMLGRGSGYVGINNHMGSKFTLDSSQMSGVMEELARQGLAFVDSKTTATSLGAIARHLKLPFLERDVFLGDSGEPGDIRARLADLERIAKKRGWAVAIGHPREATIRALAEWIADDHGIAIVPVSHIMLKHNSRL